MLKLLKIFNLTNVSSILFKKILVNSISIVLVTFCTVSVISTTLWYYNNNLIDASHFNLSKCTTTSIYLNYMTKWLGPLFLVDFRPASFLFDTQSYLNDNPLTQKGLNYYFPSGCNLVLEYIKVMASSSKQLVIHIISDTNNKVLQPQSVTNFLSGNAEHWTAYEYYKTLVDHIYICDISNLNAHVEAIEFVQKCQEESALKVMTTFAETNLKNGQLSSKVINRLLNINNSKPYVILFDFN